MFCYSNFNNAKLISFVVKPQQPQIIYFCEFTERINGIVHRVKTWQKDKFVDNRLWQWVMGGKIVRSHYLYRIEMHVVSYYLHLYHMYS